ncbi:MAG TPA: shikimate kinase [Candidatus Dormibacteraeota bacterium]|nr:shikimate kinase [Candidatus Dormibacteraeota bacterium]
MGAGKTLVGAMVAERAKARFFDLDTMVEDKAGMSIAEIFATHSEDAFRAFEKATLPNVLMPESVVALGGGVVVDDDNWRLISESSMSVYLDVPFGVLWERIRHFHGRPLVLDRSAAEVEQLLARRRPRYEQAMFKVDGNRPPSVVANEVLQLWSA